MASGLNCEEKRVIYRLFTKCLHLCCNGFSAHGEEREDGIINLLSLKGVSCEVNGQEVALCPHVGQMPEGHLGQARPEVEVAVHQAVDS